MYSKNKLFKYELIILKNWFDRKIDIIKQKRIIKKIIKKIKNETFYNVAKVEKRRKK